MKQNKKTILIQLAVLVVAVAFIVTGIMRDEHRVVLSKAIGVCLSCIGIG